MIAWLASMVIATASGSNLSETSTLTLTLTATESAERLLPAERVEFVGYRVLPRAVYRALVRLPNRWPPTQKGLDRAAKRLTDLLHLSGYTLARVEGVLDGDRARFVIDEGRLERVTLPWSGRSRRADLAASAESPGGRVQSPGARRAAPGVRGQ